MRFQTITTALLLGTMASASVGAQEVNSTFFFRGTGTNGIYANPDGSFTVPIRAWDGLAFCGFGPDGIGDLPIRVRGTGRIGGVVHFAWSPAFRPVNGTTNLFLTVSPDPRPFTQDLEVQASGLVLTGLEPIQLSVTATRSDGFVYDATDDASTTYSGSNFNLFEICQDGQIRTIPEDPLDPSPPASGSGFVWIRNEGVSRSLRVTVSPGDLLTDVTGFCLDAQEVPIPGAEVTVQTFSFTATAFSQADGSFLVEDVPTNAALAVSATATVGGEEYVSEGLSGLSPVEAGFTDAGVLVLGPQTLPTGARLCAVTQAGIEVYDVLQSQQLDLLTTLVPDSPNVTDLTSVGSTLCWALLTPAPFGQTSGLVQTADLAGEPPFAPSVPFNLGGGSAAGEGVLVEAVEESPLGLGDGLFVTGGDVILGSLTFLDLQAGVPMDLGITTTFQSFLSSPTSLSVDGGEFAVVGTSGNGSYLFSLASGSLVDTGSLTGIFPANSPVLSNGGQRLYYVGFANGANQVETYEVGPGGALTSVGAALPLELTGPGQLATLHLTDDGGTLVVQERSRVLTYQVGPDGAPTGPAAAVLDVPNVQALTVSGSTLYLSEGTEPPGSPNPSLFRITSYEVDPSGALNLQIATPFRSTSARLLELLESTE